MAKILSLSRLPSIWAVKERLLNPPPPVVVPPPEPGLLLGYHQPSGAPRVLPDKLRFLTHQHLMGNSGQGKSLAMVSYARQDIAASRCVVAIDPHGPLFYQLLGECLRRNIKPIIIDPSRGDEWTVKMNPLDNRAGVGAGTWVALAALMRVAGETSTVNTPRFFKIASNTLLALEESGEPMSRMGDFLSITYEGAAFRSEVLSRVTNPRVRSHWAEFEAMPKNRQLDMAESTTNRLAPFLFDSRITRSVSFATENIDWLEVFESDTPQVVLVNLSPGRGRPLDEASAQLCGTLCMLGIRYAAMRRQEGARQVCVYCDEVQRYINEDLADNLDELRKFGIHYTLAHHRLSQLETVSKNVCDAVLQQARVKQIFGGLPYEDAQRLALEMFTGEFDGTEVKYEQKIVAFEPVQSWQLKRSIADGTHSAMSEGHGDLSSSGASLGSSGIPGGLFEEGGPTVVSEGESSGSSSYDTYSFSKGTSHVETVTPELITEYVKFNQESSLTFVSIEEQRERRVVMLMTLPQRGVAVKIPGKFVELIKTIDVDTTLPPNLEAYAQACWSVCSYVVPASDDALEPPVRASTRFSRSPAKPQKPKQPKKGTEPQLPLPDPPPETPPESNGYAADDLGL